MKKLTLLFLAFLLFVPILKAQDDELDDMDFEEIPVEKEMPTYFAIGAGYIGGMSFINYDDINAKLDEFDLPGFSGNIYMSGVHGFTGIGIIPNLRLGFFGQTGSKQVNQDSDSIKFGSSLAINYMGFTLDYGFVLFKHFAILPGIQVGWSGLEQHIYKTRTDSDSPNWGDIKPGNDIGNYSKNIKGSFWFLQPQIYLEYALTPFLMARASAGYNLSFNLDWEYNSSTDLKGVPDGITTSGWSAQFGIFVGLFNF